jgi:hypothetical protein
MNRLLSEGRANGKLTTYHFLCFSFFTSASEITLLMRLQYFLSLPLSPPSDPEGRGEGKGVKIGEGKGKIGMGRKGWCRIILARA